MLTYDEYSPCDEEESRVTDGVVAELGHGQEGEAVRELKYK